MFTEYTRRMMSGPSPTKGTRCGVELLYRCTFFIRMFALFNSVTPIKNMAKVANGILKTIHQN